MEPEAEPTPSITPDVSVQIQTAIGKMKGPTKKGFRASPAPAKKISARTTGEPGPDHATCQKCKLHDLCTMKFGGGHAGQLYLDAAGTVQRGKPEDPSKYVMLIGGSPDLGAEEQGDMEGSIEFTILRAAWEKMKTPEWGSHQHLFWYVPAVLCHAKETPERKGGKLTKGEIKRCFQKHVLPFIQGAKPKVIVAAGPVAAYAILGTMDSERLERTWHRGSLGITYTLREPARVMVNAARFKDPFLKAFQYALQHKMESVQQSIAYVVARSVEEVEDWFGPVLEAVQQDLEEVAASRRIEARALSWDTETNTLHLWRPGFKIQIGRAHV